MSLETCHEELFPAGVISIKRQKAVDERLACIFQVQPKREIELQAQFGDVPMLMNIRHTPL